MKNIILFILSLCLFQAAFAQSTKVKIQISDISAKNPHYLCFYGAHCYHMRSGESGRVFNLPSHVFNHIEKAFIVEMHTRRISTQPLSESCKTVMQHAKDASQTITVLGTLVYKKATPQVENLRCEVS